MSWPEDLEKHTSLEPNVKASDYLESKTAILHRAGDAVAGGRGSSLQDGRSPVVSNCVGVGSGTLDKRRQRQDA